MWEKDPQVMHAGLEVHNACLRKCIAENRGYEVKTVGDSFVVAFHNVPDAAAFMLSAQHALLQQSWSEALLKLPNCESTLFNQDILYRQSSKSVIASSPIEKAETPSWLWRGLRVRMGCHVGAVDREYCEVTGRVDYFGPAVNMAARIESLAHGGEILVSELCCAANLRESHGSYLRSLGMVPSCRGGGGGVCVCAFGE